MTPQGVINGQRASNDTIIPPSLEKITPIPTRTDPRRSNHSHRLPTMLAIPACCSPNRDLDLVLTRHRGEVLVHCAWCPGILVQRLVVDDLIASAVSIAAVSFGASWLIAAAREVDSVGGTHGGRGSATSYKQTHVQSAAEGSRHGWAD